jgi:pteridine reductase
VEHDDTVPEITDMQKATFLNKVALVTGSARRIGKSIATHLHTAGMRIIIHYSHSQDEATALAASFNQKRPHSALLLKADFNQSINIQSLSEEAIALFGQIDVLVNNASQFIKTPIETLDEKTFDQLLQVNLKLPFLFSQALASSLTKTKGCIINITDIHGNCPLRDYGMYSITKAGLIMATKVLAKELAPNVRVNAVSPGAIIWPEGDNTLPLDSQHDIIQSTLLKREGTPDDIAKAVLFLAEDAGYVTGQIIAVDGGRLLTAI